MTSTRDILERNDLVYKALPPRWVFGLPIGNGQIGGMIWVEDETKVVVTLDSVWAWDLRQTPKQATYGRFRELMAAEKYDEIGPYLNTGEPLPRKTYVGRLVIDVGRKISGEGRLRLGDAEVELDLRTDDGETIRLKFVAYANLPAIAVDHPQTGIKEIRLERLSTERVGLHDAPEYVQGTLKTIEFIRQDIPDSPSIVLGLHRGETQSFATVQATRNGSDPVEEALLVLERALATPGKHLKDHRAWWGRFWEKSSVQVPDEKIESLWYMGLYMLAGASRKGGCAASLHGVWSPDNCIPPAHGFYIWDFYSQHWGLYTANHLELGEAFCDHFHLDSPASQGTDPAVLRVGWRFCPRRHECRWIMDSRGAQRVAALARHHGVGRASLLVAISLQQRHRFPPGKGVSVHARVYAVLRAIARKGGGRKIPSERCLRARV